MADGAVYTYIRGDEYHNIFPFWNWRRIPGITTYESNAPIPTDNGPNSRNKTNFTGGVTNGKQGITAMHLNRNGLSANKVWIFTNEFILCLGSDIHADSTATLITSIDQRFKNGEIWTEGNRRYFHDNTGYILLQDELCLALAEKKKGQWHDFMGMYAPGCWKMKFSLFTSNIRQVSLLLTGIWCSRLPLRRRRLHSIFQKYRYCKMTKRHRWHLSTKCTTLLFGRQRLSSCITEKDTYKKPGTYLYRADGTPVSQAVFPKGEI